MNPELSQAASGISDFLQKAKSQAISGALQEALVTLIRLRAECAPSAESEFQIGELLCDMGLLAPAVEAFWRSVNLDPSHPKAYEKLSVLYWKLNFQGRSAWYSSRAARLSCFDQPSLGAMARSQYRVGRVESSIRTYRRALKLDPSDAQVHAKLLFTMLHSSRHSPAALKEAHENWIRLHCQPAPRQQEFLNSRDPDRKLRLGYLGQDLSWTPDRHFLIPVLENHDHRNADIYIFNTMPCRDAVTDEYMRQADVWRDVSSLNSKEIAEQIRRDQIDVLIERSGHMTVGQTIPVFQQRPAPVQVAYLDYPCTTGCREIDYLVSDQWTTPEAGFAQEYSERSLYCLPHGALLYAPPPELPVISELPARHDGHLTFGLLQRPAKFNDDLWNAVAAILRQVTHSRLLVQHGDAELDEADSGTRVRIVNQLCQRGITEERITFIGGKQWPGYFDVVAGVDIALDTFPYSGTTTTCGCLWMGVPVVTFSGERHSSRVSGAILSRMGLEDWVAHSLDEYVQIAVAKTSDVTALANLRAGLRERMSNSSVCRPEIVVRELEEAYRSMWRQWCASQ